jgi:hypothetical protein
MWGATDARTSVIARPTEAPRRYTSKGSTAPGFPGWLPPRSARTPRIDGVRKHAFLAVAAGAIRIPSRLTVTFTAVDRFPGKA